MSFYQEGAEKAALLSRPKQTFSFLSNGINVHRHLLSIIACPALLIMMRTGSESHKYNTGWQVSMMGTFRERIRE